MSSIRVIKRRIRSVRNINDITKAMEIISSVRFRRVEIKLRKSLPYFDQLKALMHRLASPSLVEGNPFFESRTVKRELVIFATGDRGLCGSFNHHVTRQLDGYLKENPGRDISVFPVGKVGLAFARRSSLKIYDQRVDLGYRFTLDDLKPVTEKLVQAYLSGKFDAIKILAMRLVRIGVQKPFFETFLGLEDFLTEKKESTNELSYIFEPNQRVALEAVTELFIRQNFYIKLLHSVTAEYNARMIAMKLASDNGEELLKDLTLLRNKIRQAMITQEIGEIIGGVNALS